MNRRMICTLLIMIRSLKVLLMRLTFSRGESWAFAPVGRSDILTVLKVFESPFFFTHLELSQDIFECNQ